MLEATISGKSPPAAEDREFCRNSMKFLEENLPMYQKLFNPATAK